MVRKTEKKLSCDNPAIVSEHLLRLLLMKFSNLLFSLLWV